MNSVAATTSTPAEGVTLDMGAFVRSAAHDIANPLNAIAMNAELVKLLLERDQPQAALAAVDRLLADCARCGRFIQGMQRFGSGLHAGPRETISVRALIEAAIHVVKQEACVALPAFRVDGIDEQIHGDRPALERGVVSLLHNAVEAGAKTVQINLRHEVGMAVMEIRDDGAGISPESRSRVAEPFFSTRRVEGNSGLGLTLVRELLRTHLGQMHIAENAPRGMCVELRVPVAPKPGSKAQG